MKYSVYVAFNLHGLIPWNGSGPSPPNGAKYSGWLIFHQGDLFMMPSGVKDFLFVFKGGATDGDSVEFAFSNWSRS
jgi:hypothetical protein